MEHRTPAIVAVWLEPMNEPMVYRPGEYVLLEDPMRQIPPRSYSIANAPRPDGLISLLITRVAAGTTSVWVHDQLPREDEVTFTGPYGTFVAEAASAAPCLYLAARSGLAPIRALIEAALEAIPQRPLTLIFSARTEEDVLDRERFGRWQARYPHLRFTRTLTRGPGPAPHGRVPCVLEATCPRLEGYDVFIAGAGPDLHGRPHGPHRWWRRSCRHGHRPRTGGQAAPLHRRFRRRRRGRSAPVRARADR